MSNKFPQLNAVKKIFKSYYLSLSLGLLVILLATYIIKPDIFPFGKNQKAQIQEISTTNTTSDNAHNTQAESNDSAAQNQSTSQKEGGMTDIVKPPSSIGNKIKFPATQTPTPTSSSGLNVNMNFVKNMKPNNTINSNVTKNALITEYALYLGQGKDIDPSFPPETYVFVGVEMDKQDQVIVDYYIVAGNGVKNPQNLKKVVYKITYTLDQVFDPVQEDGMKFILLGKLNDYDAYGYSFIVTGKYKGLASDTLGEAYKGYVDLQSKWQGQTIHVLISRLKTSNIPYEVGKQYTFIVEKSEVIDQNSTIYMTSGGLVYLQK